MRMFDKVVAGLLVVFCFDGDCMKTVSIAVQGVNERKLTVAIERKDETSAPISLRTLDKTNETSISLLTDGVFGITLVANSFAPQRIDIKEDQTTIFKILVEKATEYDQPRVKLSDIVQGVVCALYRCCSGGGNAFVLAIGRTEQDVSLQSVQEHQALGKMQAFARICL